MHCVCICGCGLDMLKLAQGYVRVGCFM
uniref:Uncharacterized protein n=1 Tax=Arundo donax TaxID=35708 RepID=A0A0A9A4H6_ARUDO